METPRQADLIIEARWIIPVEPENTTLAHHSVVIHRGLIIDLLPTSEARIRYTAERTRSLPEHILLPGLVNAHTHAAMSLLRGIADDMPLMPWLETAIWPIEKKLVSPQFVYDGTLLAAAEMLRGGVTCCADMYFFPDQAAQAFEDAGMRASVGMVVYEFPCSYANSADDYLDKGFAARDKWKDHPRISFALAPHSPYAIHDATFERIGVLADELDVPIHIHAYETAQEVRDSLARYGMRPLARLDKFGLVGPGLQLAHGVSLAAEELAMLASSNSAVIHNPTSNMKLASGIAPVPRMLEQGITVALGTDSAASNNRLDILQEMRHAALLAKVSSGDAGVLPAHQAIRMATLHGARALGLETRIGAIRAGLEADLCAISLEGADNLPCYEAASHVVYVAGRESISDVWVQGTACVQEGRLLHMSNTDLVRISRLWQNSAKPW